VVQVAGHQKIGLRRLRAFEQMVIVGIARGLDARGWLDKARYRAQAT
jgi:hypothetical protein